MVSPLETQLRAERVGQELFLNRIRTATWFGVGTLLTVAGLSHGATDPFAGLYLGYALLCFLVGPTLIRQASGLAVLPVLFILADVGILIASGFWAGGDKLQNGVLQGLIAGLALILCSGALRFDWVPCAIGGGAGMAGLFALRLAYEPFDLYLLVTPLTVGVIVLVLCLGIRRSRAVAEHLFDEVHNTHEQRTMVMGQLVAGVAHEMNSPLGALRSSLATMGRALDKLENVPDRSARAFSSSTANAEAALDRIDEFLARLEPFASLDAPPQEEVKLKALLQSVVDLQRGAQPSRIHVRLQVPDGEAVLGNSAQLGIVFLNLLRNAAEAAGDGGHVDLSSEVVADRVRIRIADDGPGMTDEAIADAFAPAFSNQNGRVKLGLGLVVARGILHRHEGRLELGPGAERGTVVQVELPRFHRSEDHSFVAPTPARWATKPV